MEQKWQIWYGTARYQQKQIKFRQSRQRTTGKVVPHDQNDRLQNVWGLHVPLPPRNAGNPQRPQRRIEQVEEGTKRGQKPEGGVGEGGKEAEWGDEGDKEGEWGGGEKVLREQLPLGNWFYFNMIINLRLENHNLIGGRTVLWSEIFLGSLSSDFIPRILYILFNSSFISFSKYLLFFSWLRASSIIFDFPCTINKSPFCLLFLLSIKLGFLGLPLTMWPIFGRLPLLLTRPTGFISLPNLWGVFERLWLE